MFGKIRKKYWEKIQGVKASRWGTPKLEWYLLLERFSELLNLISPSYMETYREDKGLKERRDSEKIME